MKTPASSYILVLDLAYGIALLALLPLAGTAGDVFGQVLLLGPVVVTFAMLVGRYLILRSVGANTSAGRSSLWLLILGIYIWIAWLSNSLSHGFTLK